MAVVGSLPSQYLGRGPGPLYIGIAITVEGIWISPRANRDGAIPLQAHHQKNTPREAVLPLYYSSLAPEAIHHTTHWIRGSSSIQPIDVGRTGGPSRYKTEDYLSCSVGTPVYVDGKIGLQMCSFLSL